MKTLCRRCLCPRSKSCHAETPSHKSQATNDPGTTHHSALGHNPTGLEVRPKSRGKQTPIWFDGHRQWIGEPPLIGPHRHRSPSGHGHGQVLRRHDHLAARSAPTGRQPGRVPVARIAHVHAQRRVGPRVCATIHQRHLGRPCPQNHCRCECPPVGWRAPPCVRCESWQPAAHRGFGSRESIAAEWPHRRVWCALGGPAATRASPCWPSLARPWHPKVLHR